jgi:hypothetical protein
MKRSLLILSLLTASLVLSAAHAADTETQTIKCHKFFGNPIFDSLTATFTTTKTGKADRNVDVVVNYQHSGIDSNYYTRPITAKVTVIDLANKDLKISFDDNTFGDNDYSGGSLDFSSVQDDTMENIVSVQYSSDGPSYFGLLQCDRYPHFSW